MPDTVDAAGGSGSTLGPVMARHLVTRVERTFGFVDISGFTKFTDGRGDAAAVAALADFRAAVRDVSSRHGVRIDKWLGDGAMFVCVDTAPLVHAVLDIESRLVEDAFPLPLRAGVASGLVILFEGDDYIGTPVNLASRLCVEAAPGQVLVTETVAQSAPGWVSCSTIGKLEVRGLADPVAVVAITGPAAAASSTATASSSTGS
jgi:adenylate cyclase